MWPSIAIKTLWYTSMITARLASILLFIVVFGLWTMVPLGLHWAAMTVWIISEKTSFCPTKKHEILYNIVVGFIYCFCYIDLKVGETRFRLLTFYSIFVAQNLASVFIFILVTDDRTKLRFWAIISVVLAIGGTISGVAAMILFYKLFHPEGSLKWNNFFFDEEMNNADVSNSNEGAKKSESPGLQIQSKTAITICKVGQENENTDQNLLLDNWIARSGTPTFLSAPVANNTSLESSGIEIFTVENTPEKNINCTHTISRNNGNRSKSHLSQTDLNLKPDVDLTFDESKGNNISQQKRRGMCTSDELIGSTSIRPLENSEQLKANDRGSDRSQDTDSSDKKTSSGSIDLDLDLSFSDVNSSDINMFNENIVQKLCLSTLKNIKDGHEDADIQNIQKIALEILKEMYCKKGKKKSQILNRDIETSTEVLSVHDYENICAVNIAREAWGIRSWNDYSDIENLLHDGSVFRERRNGTFTSASSEISSCISHELRNNILNAPPVPFKKSHVYSNILVKHDYVEPVYISKNDTQMDVDVFIAKPCLVENANQLEPIMEELDDLVDSDTHFKTRLNSESSLVATIDEIRKRTAANSPRNVYHRREIFWESPQMHIQDSKQLESKIKTALWKEPSKLALTNSLPYAENSSSSKAQKLIPQNKESYSHSEAAQKKKIPNKTYKHVPDRKVINKTDLSSLDLQYLSHLVSESNIPFRLTSIEDLANNDITSSMKSLMEAEPNPDTVNIQQNKLAKKANKNRPRRKFSLLREKFEPKPVLHKSE